MVLTNMEVVVGMFLATIALLSIRLLLPIKASSDRSFDLNDLNANTKKSNRWLVFYLV